ncbi:unnamed protein product [Nezara viridula]|uniref:Uncharacterized protein n=1 Tax=Nezara viridula TaxID=85310 RepID=A0A9P0H0P7_NEZVI|nr:unnamed protein product [Nezara viridula]
MEQRAADFPLDHYLEFEKMKKKHKTVLEQERAEQELEPKPFSRTEKLIKQINELTTEAEEKVRACIYNKAAKPSSVFSPVSLDESDSGYTEHLVEAKFNEVTFQKPKGSDSKTPQEIRKNQPSQLRKPYINKSFNNPVKYGRQTYGSTTETMSNLEIPSKQLNQKKFNTKLDSSKRNPRYISKSSSLSIPESRNIREEFPEPIYAKTNCHYCLCAKDKGIGNHLKHLKETSKRDQCRHKSNKLYIDDSSEQLNATYKEKHYNDVSVNTDPLLLRPNTNLISVVSSKEERSNKTNDYAKKLCQIQELPLVVIRPNFTKQVGPIIDIKTTMPSSPKNNVAVVECIHGGTTARVKENTSVNVIHESGIDSASQTVNPPAVHFKNSRDLKLLKVTKDLLGKLNFKDGTNVERLKRSLTSLVTLLNQISPIHVANLRISNLDAGSASESIDTFFSNIDLVTEIIENEIKKPTGRYCDYPECLIKAVDLLCGNIRSVFVIEDVRKRTSKPCTTNGSGEEKKKVKKSSVPSIRKQISKTTLVSQKTSVTSSVGTHETEGNMVAAGSMGDIPGHLYIPYRLLIPGGKHKAMEEARNSQDIELRFKRLEKVLEINENLRKAVPSKESSQTDHSMHSTIDEDKSISNKDAHVLNETFIIKSASEDEEESEIIQEKNETKINKADQDYEDDWEDAESSKSYDGSLAMTDINVVAQVHSSGGQTSLAHSSPKKQLSVSSKGSQTGTLPPASRSSSRASQNHSKDKEAKDIKRQTEPIPDNKKVHSELKDVETQYYVGKRDISTMYCEEKSESQKPKVEILEPINVAPETGCFTVLRMTNASTNSLLEVRFPEQTEKLQSSLTVQKTHNSEEVKLLYNLDKDDKIISRQVINENGLKSVPPRKEIVTIEPIQIDAPKNIEKVFTKCEQNIDEKASLQKKEDINDFQNITTNFIQFLENKVTEMVNKFKTSEVTCENLLDQKLTSSAERKASVNNLHISSSKTSLKNEVFYKSASSLISTQSNDDFGNWLSRRCTPDNQEIVPFENLTSPPVGLQLKDSNALIETSDPQNMDRRHNLQKIEDSNLFGIPFNLVRERQSSDNRNSDKFNSDLISDKSSENMKLVLKEKEIDKVPIARGLHNRLFPLPEDVNYSRRSSSNEKEKLSFPPATQFEVTADIHERVENFDQKSTTEQAVETSSLKNNETGNVQEVDISNKQSISFEEAISALVSVEQSFDVTDSIEESTVIVAKTPTIASKSEDELDSQGTSVSHFANILSASESGNAPKYTFQDKILISVPKDLNSSVPSESKISQQEQKSMNSVEALSMKKDFSRLLPIPEKIEKDQPDEKLYDTEQEAVSNASVHSLFVSGPSHVDRSLKSSDYLFRKMGNSPVLTLENESSSHDEPPKIPSPTSSSISVENLAFDNPSRTSSRTISDTIKDNIPKKRQFDNYSQTSPPKEDIMIQTLPLSSEDVSEISDDYIKLNYFNPEEMSEGEIGYVYTSNSYSSGEIKPYSEQNEDDILTEPSTVRETPQHFESAISLEHGEPNLLSTISENRTIVKRTLTELGTSEMYVMHTKIMERVSTKSEKNQDIFSVGDLLNSSNDSTSTGELKKLFSKEDKIDEEKLIDIHVHCSTRFSSESSGGADSVESRESREDD